MTRVIFLACIFLICSGFHKSPEEKYRIAFYNVENLFDLVDEPEKKDDDFTPEGANKWTEERYKAKIESLAKVIQAMESPAIMGLCEIENGQVLSDLAAHPFLADAQYKYVHFDSPDERGIDNALLYNPRIFEPTETKTIRIDFPPDIIEDYTTRDVLIVRGKFLNNYEITIIVNHWPSRRDGLEESEPRRTFVAQKIREYLDGMHWGKRSPLLFIMGDFNDEPDNNSIKKTLGASGSRKEARKTGLFNYSWELKELGKGTYNFRGDWNMLDQIIVSSPLLRKRSGFRLENAHIFKQDWMMYTSDKFGETPNRTYGGPNYYGGYSDHLPVYLEFTVK